LTNTLHRRGSIEDLKKDYVMLMISSPKANKTGSAPLKQQFLEIVAKHNPVNMGSMGQTAMYRCDPYPARRETYLEEHPASTADVIRGITEQSVATALLTDSTSVEQVLEEVRKRDFGQSVCISGLIDIIQDICMRQGISPHAVEHALRNKDGSVFGRTKNLPQEIVLEMNSMCGHGMVAFNLIKKIMDWVKLGKLSPEEGSRYLAKPCICGAFNVLRAQGILERAKHTGP
jgi:hypothetical protein